jgi:ABC-type glycerol-3-phosphate transport system permease component
MQENLQKSNLSYQGISKKSFSAPHFFSRIVIYLILIALTFTFIFPYIWLISSSFKSPEAVLRPNFELFPRDVEGNISFVINNYKQAIEELNLGLVFKNTMVVCIVNTFINLFFNSLAAYAFARLKFPGKEVIFYVALITMMVPGTVLMIPNFLIVNKIGIFDTLLCLILPFAMSVYNVFLLRQQFYALNGAIEEAARIDGASNFRIYWQISLPLVAPILVVQGITTFMWNYNNFMWPLISIRDESNYTLALSLGSLMKRGSQLVENFPITLAGAVAVSAPMIILFFLLQKYIIGGVAVGGMKD